MECHFINLDEAIDRRLSIESNFDAHRTKDWQLTRFPAINTHYIHHHKVAGTLRDSEKACFMSHRRLIGDQIGTDEPPLILEDDARFGVNTFTQIDHFLNTKSDDVGWDILFTDVAVVDPKTMIDLFLLRRNLASPCFTQLLDLSTLQFAGATAYLLNPPSIEKIYTYLGTATPLDIPYDLFLRQLIWEGKIKGYVMFPFVTTVSDWAESSQIQTLDTAYTDLTWNTFRKLMWIDRDIEQTRPAIQAIDREVCDDESRQLATIIAACTSSRFITK